MREVVWHSEPLAIGGHSVILKLPAGYSGPCRVFEEGQEKSLAITPNPDVAKAIACYAVSADGGYGPIVVVVPEKEKAVTVECLVDFI